MDGNADLDREKNWVLLSLIKKEKSTIVKLTKFLVDTGTNFDNPLTICVQNINIGLKYVFNALQVSQEMFKTEGKA